MKKHKITTRTKEFYRDVKGMLGEKHFVTEMYIRKNFSDECFEELFDAGFITYYGFGLCKLNEARYNKRFGRA